MLEASGTYSGRAHTYPRRAGIKSQRRTHPEHAGRTPQARPGPTRRRSGTDPQAQGTAGPVHR
eukprot:12951246-Alexandrium_andersonii.AAC.1